MAPPLLRSFLHRLAVIALATLSLNSSFVGVEAACVVPGDLILDGIDCLVFDPATPTTIVANFTDANLGKNNAGGTSFLQVGFRSNLNAPINDIGYRANNGTSYQLFQPTNDIIATTTYRYTSINQFYSTNPSFVQINIPGGNVAKLNETFDFTLFTNNDGTTEPDGALAAGIGNDYAAITRNFRSIPATNSPTGTPTTAPTTRPTSAPTIRPTAVPTIIPTVSSAMPEIDTRLCKASI